MNHVRHIEHQRATWLGATAETEPQEKTESKKAEGGEEGQSKDQEQKSRQSQEEATVTELVEVEPGRWRVVRKSTPPARSALPLPNVISDTMDPVEQVDGRFYTSKAAFRAVGRAHGLTEVGNEKFKPKRRSSDDPKIRTARRQTLKKAIERYRSGVRP